MAETFATKYHSDTLSPKAAALRDRWVESEQAQRAARAAQRQVEQEMDEHNLALKPSFPTQAQRDGLAEAARRIREDIKSKSHLGDSCNTPEYPAAVVVDGARGWLNIRHGSPYSQRGMGGHLWGFTDEDIWAFAEILWGQGFQVFNFWHCDGGASFQVVRRG